MIIRYIDHSGFLVDGDECSLLFDFVEGQVPKRDAEKPLFVFVSHRHRDHFSKRIFSLGAKEIFLDLKAFSHVDRSPFLSFDTFPSTDSGICFAISFEGRRIYYAGDNADWYWDEEDEKLREEHERILGMIGKVDLAFVPVDPRLPEPLTTARAVAKHLSPSLIVPMHMWGREKEILPALQEENFRVEFSYEIRF